MAINFPAESYLHHLRGCLDTNGVGESPRGQHTRRHSTNVNMHQYIKDATKESVGDFTRDVKTANEKIKYRATEGEQTHKTLMDRLNRDLNKSN